MASRNNFAKAILGGATFGAAATYLLDPQKGARRRAEVRNQAYHLTRKTTHGVSLGARDLSHRTQGMLASSLSRLKRDHASNEVLIFRVRSKLGRFVSHPHAIEVTADQGRIELKGTVLAHEREPLLRAVESVRGVRTVVDRLQVHRQEEKVPALQGGVPRMGTPIDILQDQWAPATRMLVILGTLPLLMAGFRRTGPAGKALSGIGAIAFLRAATNRELGQLLGLSRGSLLQIHKSIEIHAPVDKVFRFFSDLERYPKILTHVREVRVSNDRKRTHWVANGPAGIPVSWNAEITRLIPSQEIAWRSEPGSAIRNSGRMRFLGCEEKLTRVDLDFSCTLPAGALGAFVARIFGAAPKSRLDESLGQLKTVIEGNLIRHPDVRRST